MADGQRAAEMAAGGKAENTELGRIDTIMRGIGADQAHRALGIL